MKLWTNSHTCKEGGHVFSTEIASSMQKDNVLKQEQVTHPVFDIVPWVVWVRDYTGFFISHKVLINFTQKIVNSHGSRKTLQGLKTLWEFEILSLGRSYVIYFYKECYSLYLSVSHSFSSCCYIFWQHENGKIQIFKFQGDMGFVWTCPRLPSVASNDKRAIGWLCFLLLGDVMLEKSRRRVSNSSRFPCISRWVNYVARTCSKLRKELFKK